MCEPGMPYHEYEDEIGKVIEMHTFAEMYGWTPNQVRELSDDEHTNLGLLLGGIGEGQGEDKNG